MSPPIRHPMPSRALIAAGGTGGHIFPALAAARALQQRGVALTWVGTRRGLEERVTSEAGISLSLLDFEGVRGRGLKSLLLLPIRLLRAMAQSRQILREFQPDLVASFGGYVTVPVGLTAWLMGIPLVIHEQNAVMGSANRLLARLAQATAVSFERTQRAPTAAQWTGNPVRAELLSLGAAAPRIQGETGRLRLLVLGGSLGARPLNQALPICLSALASLGIAFEVWHQTGTADEDATRQAYGESGLQEFARVSPFIEDMAAAYRWADLVICRAGASTVTELMALGQPALFVPLPHAIDDHQTWNARSLVEAQAARLVPQTDRLADDLLAELKTLDRPVLVAMAQRAEVRRDLHATQRLLDLLGDALAKSRRLQP